VTNELADDLRRMACSLVKTGHRQHLAWKAADEIERLAALVTQWEGNCTGRHGSQSPCGLTAEHTVPVDRPTVEPSVVTEYRGPPSPAKGLAAGAPGAESTAAPSIPVGLLDATCKSCGKVWKVSKPEYGAPSPCMLCGAPVYFAVAAVKSSGDRLSTPQGEPALTQTEGLPGTREPVVTAPHGNAGESPASLPEPEARYSCGEPYCPGNHKSKWDWC
jgi:hypothetical protein